MQRQVGRHTVSFEPPWLMCLVLRGEVSADDLVGLVTARDEIASDRPLLLALIDLRELGAIPVDARKAAAQRLRRSPYRAVALFGATFQARVLAKLVLGAARLLGRDDQHPVGFFDTEAEARAWRAERAAELKGLR